ncbi:MAG: sigma-70 family RNA polymerase sigma factor [Chloroflexota bacterium]|nr:sigma-70 family RNA polymerase sigma factor [Chloroflexota bacterium]
MVEPNNAIRTLFKYQPESEMEVVREAWRDPKAFGKLYKLYVNRIFGYLFSKIQNVQEAEDLTAQTFLAAFESFDNLRNENYFSSWLFTIARHKAMDHFRTRKNIEPLQEEVLTSKEGDPLSRAIRSEQARVVSVLIQELSEDDQELLRLRFVAELSFPEIARVVDKNTEAVKKSTYRLLTRLKEQLEVNYEQPTFKSSL